MNCFKCKMCGGTIEFNQGDTVGICDSCGTKQTLPRLDDEKRANLYDRANHFRRNNDYDKAMGIYEQILNEDKTDAEADRIVTERKADVDTPAELIKTKDVKKIIAIISSIFCILLTFVILFSTVIIPNNKYETLKIAKIGDIIEYGKYEQDNNTANGKEDIEWLVLAKEDNKILIISEYALDCQPYNTSDSYVRWENCTLRTWMNDIFYKTAFTVEEQTMIQNTTVTADKNPKYSTDSGNATRDSVFLLSIAEAEKYFQSNEDRKCVPTAYAKAQGAWDDAIWWWLRSPGFNQNLAAYVDYDGSVNYFGQNVRGYGESVRPALWINLDS